MSALAHFVVAAAMVAAVAPAAAEGLTEAKPREIIASAAYFCLWPMADYTWADRSGSGY